MNKNGIEQERSEWSKKNDMNHFYVLIYVMKLRVGIARQGNLKQVIN